MCAKSNLENNDIFTPGYLRLKLYAHTHHKDSIKHYVINVHSKWHQAQSEAGPLGNFEKNTNNTNISFFCINLNYQILIIMINYKQTWAIFALV